MSDPRGDPPGESSSDLTLTGYISSGRQATGKPEQTGPEVTFKDRRFWKFCCPCQLPWVLFSSGENEDPRQKGEARRTKGRTGMVSGTDGWPWLPRALLAASSAPVPAGGIICGEGWKRTRVSGHCPGQMEGGLKMRREPCMAGGAAPVPLGSK